jgi:hypothetical protein
LCLTLSLLPAIGGKPQTMERIAVIATNGPSGKLGHLDINEDKQLLFMGNKMNKSLDIIDIQAGKLLQQMPGQEGCSGVAYSPTGDHVIVGNGLGDRSSFCIFGNEEGEYTLADRKALVGSSKVRYSYYDHNFYGQKRIGEKAYITVYDSKTLEHIKDIKVPDQHYTNLYMAQEKPLLYMSAAEQICVINTDTSELVATFPITFAKLNKAVALDEKNNRLMIGCRKPATLIVMDSETGREITSVPIKGDLDDITFDAKRKRIYAPCGEGFISVVQQIDADHYELIENIPTANRARTDLYSPGLDLYFIGVEQNETMASPEVWVYKPM